MSRNMPIQIIIALVIIALALAVAGCCSSSNPALNPLSYLGSG